MLISNHLSMYYYPHFLFFNIIPKERCSKLTDLTKCEVRRASAQLKTYRLDFHQDSKRLSINVRAGDTAQIALINAEWKTLEWKLRSSQAFKPLWPQQAALLHRIRMKAEYSLGSGRKK